MARLSRPAYLLRRHIRNELRHRVHGKNWSWVRVAVGKGSRGWMGKGKCFAHWADDHELLDLFADYERLSGHVIKAATHPDVRRIRQALQRDSGRAGSQSVTLQPDSALERLFYFMEDDWAEGTEGVYDARGNLKKRFINRTVHWGRKTEGLCSREVKDALDAQVKLWETKGPLWARSIRSVPADAVSVGELTERIALEILSAFGNTPARRRPPVREVAVAARYRAKVLVQDRTEREEMAERENQFRTRQKWIEAGFPPTARTSSADQ